MKQSAESQSAEALLTRLNDAAQFERSRPVQVNPSWFAKLPHADAAVVANALVGSLGSVPVSLGPIRRSDLIHLARGGLFFALANRNGDTDVSALSGEMFDRQSWQRGWSPSSREPLEQLFSRSALGETEYVPHLFGPYHAAFVQPHLAGPAAPTTEVTKVLRPWLRGLLPHTRSFSAIQEKFVEDVGCLVDELVDNVREHGATQENGEPAHSLVQIFVTRGSHGNRITLTVLDTGRGIPTTARPKVAAELASASDADLVEALCEGRAGNWNRARGLGLPRVWDAVRSWERARMILASGCARLEDVGDSLKKHDSNFQLAGTVVTASFVVPR